MLFVKKLVCTILFAGISHRGVTRSYKLQHTMTIKMITIGYKIIACVHINVYEIRLYTQSVPS